jgi:hypothetical protein
MDALYLAWKLDATDASSVRRAQDRLTSGAERSLYRLRCWSIGNGEARALLSPAAPLEQIAQAIWQDPSQPVFSRWIAGKRAFAAATLEITAGAGPQSSAGDSTSLAAFSPTF